MLELADDCTENNAVEPSRYDYYNKVAVTYRENVHKSNLLPNNIKIILK